jgi:hypothetical protein
LTRAILSNAIDDNVSQVFTQEVNYHLWAIAVYIDIWLSRKLNNRFGFHWERQHVDGTLYRYDNFPDTDWHVVATYPYHFHNGSQKKVEASPFSSDILIGFRDFMRFVQRKLAGV